MSRQFGRTHDRDKVAAFWGNAVPSEADIYSFGPVRDYFAALVTGCARENVPGEWLESWFKEAHLGDMPVARCLSLCCGDGERDRRIARLGYFEKCLSLDVSPKAVERAQVAATREGFDNITYAVADLNSHFLAPESVDLVYVGAGMHHIENLEHLVSQIHQCLKPGGLFVCDEYVGPSYSNLTHRHREIVNAVVHLLPKRLRSASEDSFIPRSVRELPGVIARLGTLDLRSVTVGSHWSRGRALAFRTLSRLNALFSTVRRPSERFRFGKVFDVFPDDIRRGDPSEGVRSADIIPVIKSTFDKVDVRYYNGGLVAYALDAAFLHSYDRERESDRELLDLILNMERTLTAIGEIPPIHAAIVCHK